jgi:mono/diheme cytochrome c family protein
MIEKYVDALELKRIVSTLVVVLGCLIIAGLFASIVAPGLRNANRPETPTAVAPVLGESGWLDLSEFPPAKGTMIPPVDPETLLKPSAELLARGKTLFETNCVPCHGSQGHGDGPAAGTMNPRPRNFASPDGWINGHHLPGIYKTLDAGIRSTSMSSFDYLPKKDRMALVHYVQSLGTFPHAVASPQLMNALSQTLAAAGEKIPNRIPVSLAMAKLEKEFSAAPPLRIESDDRSPGAELMRRVILDPARASQFLAQSPLWRISYRDLASAVALEMPGNGFSTSAAALNAAEWQMLYSELLRKSDNQSVRRTTSK